MATSWFKFDGDGVVTWLPAFHDMGLIAGLLFPVYGKFPCYMMAPRDFVQQPVRWLKAISRYRATHSCAPTFAFDLCSRKVTPAQRANLDLSSWIMAGNGSEPIHWETLERFANTFRDCGLAWKTISTAYGLAEATLVVTSTPPEALRMPQSPTGGRHRVVGGGGRRGGCAKNCRLWQNKPECGSSSSTGIVHDARPIVLARYGWWPHDCAWILEPSRRYKASVPGAIGG